MLAHDAGLVLPTLPPLPLSPPFSAPSFLPAPRGRALTCDELAHDAGGDEHGVTVVLQGPERGGEGGERWTCGQGGQGGEGVVSAHGVMC